MIHGESFLSKNKIKNTLKDHANGFELRQEICKVTEISPENGPLLLLFLWCPRAASVAQGGVDGELSVGVVQA